MDDIIKSIQAKVNDENNIINNSESHMERLEKLANKIESEIKHKKKNIIEPLIKKSEEQTEKISTVQKVILEKIKKKESAISEYIKESALISKNFKEFFDRKMRTEQLLKKIDEDKDKMEIELKELINKAKTFNIIASSSNVKKHVEELQKHYEQINQKKQLLKNKIIRLMEIIKGD
ncbi:MAG: hypothetical protein KKH40_05925 [Nanoarchaeota archaeon]|nr:hypothetical protein [Nanoarchaeota archaeon]